MKVGDLVYVAYTHKCGCPQSVGHIFTIRALEYRKSPGWCVWCRAVVPNELLAFGLPSNMWISAWRLKVIPPITDLNRLIEEKELERVF